MKLDFREVILRHLEHIVAVGHEDVASLFVDRHELMLALLEGGHRLFVVALHPAGLV